LPEQILPDGGQFELSPMYHALALEDVLDLINLHVAYPEERVARLNTGELREVAGRMLRWLRIMHLGDDRPGFFNDTARGIAPALPSLERYAARLGVVAASLESEGQEVLADSGYVRLSRGPAVVLLDVARVGPDYLPGHAHADTLSFEFALDSRPVIVNGGTSCYGDSADRQRERGTAAHSTVTVANQNSSEVWSGFRVGRRARPFDLVRGEWTVACSHDGYRWLRGAPVHRRQWTLGPNELRIEDRVTPATRPAVARFILAPGLRIGAAGAGRWSVREGDSEIARLIVEAGDARTVPATCATEFGKIDDVDCLEVNIAEGSSVLRIQWGGST